MARGPKGLITCGQCGRFLSPEDLRPCPKCGSTSRNARALLEKQTLGVTPLPVSVEWEKRREYTERKKVLTIIVWAITLVSPVAGYFLLGVAGVVFGLVVDIIAYFLGKYAETRVREVERGTSSQRQP